MSSRSIEILNSIQNGTAYTGEVSSMAEAILKSIANGAEYTDEPLSRLEKLLLAIKNGDRVDLLPQTRVEEILTAIANGTLGEYLAGKNLLSFPYCQCGNIVDSGISFTDNGDGSIAINGVNDDSGANSAFYLARRKMFPAGTYIGSTGDSRVEMVGWEEGDIYHGLHNGVTFTKDTELTIYIQVHNTSTAIFENVVVRPKIEVGTTATPSNQYAFKSELEEALFAAAGKLKGA